MFDSQNPGSRSLAAVNPRQHYTRYQSLYQASLEAFFQYVDQNSRSPVLGCASAGATVIDIKVCDYLLNNMEINLLMIIQAKMAVEPESMLDIHGSVEILSEIFFIKQCKIVLDIPRQKDFATVFSDSIYPMVESIVRKLDSRVHGTLFRPASSIPVISLCKFHSEVQQNIRSFLEEVTAHKYRKLVGLFIFANEEMSRLQEIIRAYIGEQAAFMQTAQELSSSIQYRIRKKERFDIMMKHQFEDAFKVLTQSMDRLSAILDQDPALQLQELDQLLSSKDIRSQEERDILEQETYRLRSTMGQGLLSLGWLGDM